MRAKTVACDFCGRIDPEFNFVRGIVSGEWTDETPRKHMLKNPSCELFEVCETCFDALLTEIVNRRVITGIDVKAIVEVEEC